MASDMPAFDEMPEAQTPDRDDEAQFIKPEPGETVVGKLAHVERDTGEGNDDIVHLIVDGEPKKKWSNATIDRRLAEEDASPGDLVGLKRHSEESTYTNDDGEEQAYHGYDVRVEARE